MDKDTVLEVNNLKKYFPIESGGFFNKKVDDFKAVDGVSFKIKKGETFGLVGESGCGKTTTAKTILRALDPTEGEVYLKTAAENVVNLAALNKNELNEIRQEIQMIFQDPYSSLNPRMPVLDLIAEPLKAHGWKKKDYKERVAELLDLVGLDKKYMPRYPHAFSGGQRQRIGIARALSLSPGLVVADEPVSALDVSVQAQILNLLDDLQQELDLTYLFIAHDLSVIKYICDRIAVMYLGKLVEVADAKELFTNPRHPYTEALLKSVPVADPEDDWLQVNIDGEADDSGRKIEGCKFAPRCKYAEKRCFAKEPELKDRGGHLSACHFAEELELEGIDEEEI